MSWTNKVLWHEGMLLRPQHFQQQDRYVEALVRARVAGLRPHGWGLREWRIDTALLETGRFGLAAVSGVLSDGTPVEAPGPADLPRPVQAPEGTRNAVVHLVLPLAQERAAESGSAEGGAPRLAARRLDDVPDSAASGARTAELVVGRPRLALVVGDAATAGHARLGIARIAELRPDGALRLDDGYIPPCLNSRAAPPIKEILDDLRGRARQLGVALAATMARGSGAVVSGVGDLLVLQAANRLAATLDHMAELVDLHPETAYAALLAAVAELAAVAASDRRPPDFPPYRHEALRETFGPVVSTLRAYLAFRGVEGAIAIPVEQNGSGMYTAWLEDAGLLASATFVLAVRANMDPEELRSRARTQIRIAPVQRLRDIVAALVPGIELRPLSYVPPQLPPPGEATQLFALDRSGQLWRELSNGFGFHVTGQLPGLELRLWAIRGGTS
jgi:type VI secretion system protein ImpJ